MHRAIIYIFMGLMIETAYAVTGTVTIGGTQTASGVLSIGNGIYLEASEQGVCGVRLIIKKVPDQLVGGNRQEYSNRIVTFAGPEPDIAEEYIDEVGSPCYFLVWGDTIGSTVHFPSASDFVICQDANMNFTSVLDGLEDETPSDYTSCPDSLACFLAAVPGEIQSDNQAIIDFAEIEFTYGYQYRYEVVSAVFKWIIENLRWRSPSNDSAHFDALGVFSDTLEPSHFNRYRTDCKGFSRLSIAFLRALGIPARFVSGTTFNALYEVPMASGGVIGLTFGHGAHAWVEVYYPDAGWIPYDPQRYLHHTDVLRYKKAHGSQNTNVHPELYEVLVWTYDPDDWYSIQAVNGDWSTLDCYSSNICSTDNLHFISIDQSYPTYKIAIADSAYAPAGACCVVPGDINDDGKVTVGDPVFLITYIFRGGPEPNCGTTADTNNDCNINVGDAVYIINYIFRGGSPPDCIPCKSYQMPGQDIALQ